MKVEISRSGFIVLLLALLVGIIMSQPCTKRKPERDRTPFVPSQPQPHARPAPSDGAVNRARERFNAIKQKRQEENVNLFDQLRGVRQ